MARGSPVVIPVTLDSRAGQQSAVELRQELLETARAAAGIGESFAGGVSSGVRSGRLGLLGSRQGRRELAFEAGEKASETVQGLILAALKEIAGRLPLIADALNAFTPGSRAEQQVAQIAAGSAAVGQPLDRETVKELLRGVIEVETAKNQAEILVSQMRAIVELERKTSAVFRLGRAGGG
jgi:hypothetical protein